VEGAQQLLIGKFAYGPFDKDLKGEDVEVFVQLSPPCGPYVSLGTVETSEENQYGTTYGITDDGGRVFFVVPKAYERPAGRYAVRLLVKGDHSVAKLTLFVVKPKTSAVVFDIDGTLTTDDFQLVTELFSDLFSGSYVPKLYTDAEKVANAWSQRSYLPIYLTGRPDLLRKVTQEYLEDEGFPPGAVHLTDTLAQALPTSAGVATYKSDFLKKMTSTTDLSLYAAYGNATTDIEAYAAAKIPTSRTFIIGSNGGKSGTVAVTTYTAHLSNPRCTPDAPRARARARERERSTRDRRRQRAETAEAKLTALRGGRVHVRVRVRVRGDRRRGS
jgi:hypothetical protein